MSTSRKRRKREEATRHLTGKVRAGDVPADTSQQSPACYGKRKFYRDQPFTCGDCGREEVWTATQQKWYFEVAKGSIYGTAKYCRACRQKRRRAKEEQRRRSQP